MADTKLSALTAVTDVQDTDEYLLARAGVSNKITAANLLGAWVSSAPTLTAVTTPPTLGSGSVAKGRYLRLGDLVIYAGEIVFGSSGVAAGSGNYKLSLPVALDITRTDNIGQAQGYDSSAPLASVATAYVFDANYACFRSHASTALWNNAAPWTWAASDRIDFLLMYEAA